MTEQPVQLPAVAAPDETAAAPSRRAGGAYRTRFAIVYTVLAVIGGIAIGALIVLVTRPDAAPASKWSDWTPSGSDTAKTKQIADHVASHYRLVTGEQLVIALSGAPTVTAGSSEGTGDIPVRAIAVRPDTSKGQAEESDVSIVDASTSHQYILCGLGSNCSIGTGKPSEARHALLRREAIELALYTFKYVPHIDSITVFLPPRPDGGAAPTAVFLQRGDIQAELHRPLAQTLEPTTPLIGQLRGQELATVNRITRPRLYGYQYQQAQDGSAVLVLDPVVTAS